MNALPIRHRSLMAFAAAVAVIFCGCTRKTAAPSGEPLPVDPAMRVGRLKSGLRYWIRPHRNPAGRVALRMQVAVGSADETPEEIGAAHFVEHMAFNGSQNFAPGQAEAYLRSLGLQAYRDVNAATGVDTTVYRLVLPSGGDALARGLLFLGDIARRLSLAPEEVDRERGVLISEERVRRDREEGPRAQLFSLLAPGSKLARSADVSEAQIRALSPERLRAFYARWYRPEAVTLLAVGDVDPDAFETLIAAEFGSWPAAAGRPRPALLGALADQPRAAVVAGPRGAPLVMSLNWLEPVAPATTEAELDRDLLRGLGRRLLAQRLQARLRGEAPRAQVAVSGSRRFGHLLTRVRLQAPESAGWPSALAILRDESRRIAAAPPSAEEWQRLVGGLQGSVDNQRRIEPQTPSEAMIETLLQELNEGASLLSAEQMHGQVARFVARARAQQLPEVMGRMVDPQRAAALLEAPAGAPAIDSGQVLAVLKAAGAPAAPAVAGATAEVVLAPIPEGQAKVSSEERSASGVVSLSLSNGARAHLLALDTPNDRVIVSARLSDPAGAPPSLEAAIAQAFANPRTAERSPEELRRYRQHHGLELSASATPDGTVVKIVARASAFAAAMDLLYHLLQGAQLDLAVWSGWAQDRPRAEEARRAAPGYQLERATRKALGAAAEEEPAGAVPSHEQVSRALARRLAQGNLEVAVVGEAPAAEMKARALRSLAPLPPRAPERARARVSPLPPRAPERARARVSPKIDQLPAAETVRVAGASSGTVRLGWRGPDPARTQDRRAVRAAMRVVSTRLSQELREQQGLTYTVSAGLNQLTGGAPGSWFGTTFEVAPDRAGQAMRAARAVFEAFARRGPTESELAACLLGLKSDIARAHASADYWSAVLVGLSARGVPLAEEERAAEANARLTATDLRRAAARYTTDAGRFEVVLLPPLASAR